MKQFNATPNGGVKLYNEDFMFLQESMRETFDKLIAAHKNAANVEVIILKGLNFSTSGGSGTFSDGFIYLDGEIMEFQESSYSLIDASDFVWDWSVEVIQQRALANNVIAPIYTKKVARLVPIGTETNTAIPFSSHARIESSINEICKNQDFVNYVGENLSYTNANFLSFIENSFDVKHKVYDLGQWNIAAFLGVRSVNLTGLTISNHILSAKVMIYPDEDLIADPSYNVVDASENEAELTTVFVSPGSWRLDIDVPSGTFFKTSSDYNSNNSVLGANRGYVLISHT